MQGYGNPFPRKSIDFRLQDVSMRHPKIVEGVDFFRDFEIAALYLYSASRSSCGTPAMSVMVVHRHPRSEFYRKQLVE